MCHGLAEVAVVTVGAVVTVSAGGVVPAFDADTAAAASRQQVELLVEATATRVQVAATRYTHTRSHIHHSATARTQHTSPPCATHDEHLLQPLSLEQNFVGTSAVVLSYSIGAWEYTRRR